MTKSVLAAAILLSLAACGEKPAETTPAAETVAASAEAASVPEAAKPGFKKEFELNGIRFVVEATNDGSMNNLTITPTGLSEVNDVISREIDGSVTNAEIGDINADGSPEIYVWVNSAGSGSYATPIGYASNNNKSMRVLFSKKKTRTV